MRFRCVALLLALFSSTALAETKDEYVQSLIARAHELHLANSKAWLKLLHYRPGFAGGWKSDADGPAFFLAKDGKRDPSAELDATLEGIFRDTAPEGREHAQCQFPARSAWLYKELKFDLSRLTFQKCEKLKEFLGQVSPAGATLVFSSYYLNNPASAFGHTFLRMNKAPRGMRLSKDELRDYAFNFAASVDTDNKLVYGLKGLFGGFHGDWSYQLYFYKVREYSEYESRDLWEYDLKLTPEELAMLVAHLWELGGTWFDYFYIDENCSFQILAAIEAVSPERELTEELKGFVIPADTVRAAVHSPGLVEGVYYRPSIRKQFETRAAGLSDEELELVKKLDDDQQLQLPATLSPERQAAVFDAALDFVDLRDAEALVHQSDRKVIERKQHLLERRAKILIPSPPLKIEAPVSKQPDQGHLSSRAGLGVGFSSSGEPFFRYQVRAVFHDLADAPAGYPELAQVEFFELKARNELPFERFMLEDAYLAKIESITPMTRFDKSNSWHLQIGATTLRDGGCRKQLVPVGVVPRATNEGQAEADAEGACLAGELLGGTGLAAGFFDDRLVVYGLADGALHGSKAIDGPWGLPLRLTVAPHAGARLKITERLLTVLDGTYNFHLEHGDSASLKVRESWTGTATVRFTLSDRFAFDLEGRALSYDGKAPHGLEAAASTLLYF